MTMPTLRVLLVLSLVGVCLASISTPPLALRPSHDSTKAQKNNTPSLADGLQLRLRGGEQEAETAKVTQLTAQIELECNNLLGEAPMWNDEDGKLYWLDINGKKLWAFNPTSKESQSWDLPEVAGSFAFREGGGFLMGFASGLTFWKPDTGKIEPMVCEYEEGLNTRPNDGKCDRHGNFVIGSYNNNHREDKKNIAGLWRLNCADLQLEEILDYKFRCSNTIAFDASGETMYFCDTPTKKIFKFKYSPNKPLSGKTLFYEMGADEAGGPDGATVDSEGGLWEAQAGNWKVVRHNPSDGSIDYEIKLPFNNPTSVAIGGRNMDTLYITTARHRLTEEQRKEQPGAGHLWSCKLPDGLKGIPEAKLKA